MYRGQIGRARRDKCVCMKEARETEAGKGNANGRTMIVRDRCACDFLGLNRADIPKTKRIQRIRQKKPIDSEETNIRDIL